MFIEDFAYLGNYAWENSIQNIGLVLGEQDSSVFSNNDYFYLSSIYYMNGPTLTELAKRHDMSKPQLSAIIRKLIKLELVEKIQSENDRRYFTVHLTEKGKSIILGDEKFYGVLEGRVKKIIADEEKFRELERVIGELVRQIKEEMENAKTNREF